MVRFFEFLINHWILSGLWAALFAALMFYINSKTGSSVSPQQATMLVNREDGVILDIRDRKEFEQGHIVDAINMPLAKVSERIVELEKKKEHPVVVVCQMGHQSGEVVRQLEERGFTKVSKMSGGMSEWRAQSLPVVR